MEILEICRHLKSSGKRTHQGTPKIQDSRYSPSWILMQKCDFLKKLSNLELWSLLTTYRKSVVHGLIKESISGPLKSKMAEIRHLENQHDVIFSVEGGPIWIKFRRLVQNGMSTALMCGNGNHM